MTENERPTKAELRELWEWCGFEYKDFNEYVYGPLMHGGKQYEKAWFAPNGDNWLDELPPCDLNNIFKGAVPKAIEKLENRFDAETNLIRGLELLFAKWLNKVGEGYSLEDGLFRAIQEVMRGKS